MSPYQIKQKDKKRKNLFRKIHRWIGFSSVVFLLNLAITGILLNHSNDLNLHKKYISSVWLINWYGITSPEGFKCVQAMNHSTQLCLVGSIIYKDNSMLIEIDRDLIGLVEIDEFIYVATENEIIIYTTKFELVERLNSANGLPKEITAIGFILIDNTQYLSFRNNQKTWFFDAENNIWKISEQIFQPSDKLIAAQPEHLQDLKTNYLNNKISYLKLVQDVHNGRILNISGKITSFNTGDFTSSNRG